MKKEVQNEEKDDDDYDGGGGGGAQKTFRSCLITIVTDLWHYNSIIFLTRLNKRV